MKIQKHHNRILFAIISTLLYITPVFNMNEHIKMDLDLDKEASNKEPKKRIIIKRNPIKKVLSYNPENHKPVNLRLKTKLKNYTFGSKNEKLLVQKKILHKNLYLYFSRLGETSGIKKIKNFISIHFDFFLDNKNFEEKFISQIKNDTFYEDTRTVLINEVSATLPNIFLNSTTEQYAKDTILNALEKNTKIIDSESQLEKNLFKNTISSMISDLFNYCRNSFLNQIEYFI